jgi:hypothetical protein
VRRLAAVTLSSIALAAIALPAALADTTQPEHLLAVDLPTIEAGGVLVAVNGCSASIDPPAGAASPTFSITNTNLDTLAPSTKRVWNFSFQPGDVSGASGGPLVEVANSSDLAVFSEDVYNGTSGQAVVAYANADQTGWIGRAPIAGTAHAWAQVSGANRTYSWTQIDANRTPTGVTSTGTIAAFATAHGQPTAGWGAALGFGCDAQSFGFQNLVYGDTPGNLTVVDYEDLTNNLASKPSASFVAAGGAVTVGGSSQYGGPSTAALSFRDATMSSYATAHSTVSATSVNDLTCSASATTFVCRNIFAGVVLHPKYNVTYRWCYGSTVAVQAACNSFGTIHVQATIAATFPSSISAGQRFTVSGKVTPLRPGTLVGLWGRHGTTTVRIGVATVTSAGTYSINASVGSGAWTMWLTTANDKLNAAGKSASKTYTVR